MHTKERYPFPEPDKLGNIVLKITSADQAWALFKFATESKQLPENIQIIFEGWPTFEMKVNGKDWDSTVPTRVMGPLLEIQKDLNRAYTQICYGTDNLRKLKEGERDLLEIVVRVEKGSSDFQANLANQLTELSKAAVGKMSGKEIVTAVLGIALVYGGVEINKAWVAQRQAAVQSEQTVKLSEQETERLKIFAQAVTAAPVLAEVKADREDSQNRVLKSLHPTDSIALPGVQLKGAEAAEITHQDRARATDVDISGTFRVLANDASKHSGFRIKVERISDRRLISADVPLELPDEQKALIQKAEWSKGTILVNLKISASELRDKISNATVYSATTANE